MRFSSSLQIMLSLGFKARSGDESLVTSTELADSLGTNPALVRKLLLPLAHAGLIETFKGKTGGAKIAKAPKDISLRQIYEAAVIDKEIACTRDTTSAKCPVGSCMEKLFGTISNGMESALLSHLDSKTLHQVMAQVK